MYHTTFAAGPASGAGAYHGHQASYAAQVQPPRGVDVPLNRCAVQSTQASPLQNAGLLTNTDSRSHELHLEIRQNPKEALVALDGKERGTSGITDGRGSAELTSSSCSTQAGRSTANYPAPSQLTRGSRSVRLPLLNITAVANDLYRHFLQSPYLFMCASLYQHPGEQPKSEDNKDLVGTLASSLHRLKDTNDTGMLFVHCA